MKDNKFYNQRKVAYVEANIYMQNRTTTTGAVIKTRARSSTIVQSMVGKTFEVYNGKKYIPVNIEAEMVGTKLGEYSPTRVFVRHGGDKSTDRAKSKGGKK
jgi:ribosomal protein S19